MKTKIFLLICLLLGLVTSQLSAQPHGKGGTNGSDTWVLHHDGFFVLNIKCDGKIVDQISATNYNLKISDHFTNGTWVKFTEHVNNFTGTSTWTSNTGEEFKMNINEHAKDIVDDGDFIPEGGTCWSHYQFNGNMGSRYFVRIKWDMATNTMLEYEAKCL